MAGGFNELYPTVPWHAPLWSALITAVLALIVGALSQRGVTTDGTVPSAGSLLTDTALFLPHALILFGILADMFRMEGVYSIPSLLGLLSIPANWLLDYFWAGIAALIGKAQLAVAAGTGTTVQQGGGVIDYKGCYVQGFEKAGSKYASQTLVVTSTILVYYIMDLLMNKGIVSALPSLIVGAVLFIGQVGSMGVGEGKCFESNTDLAVRSMASLANGVLFGGLSYGIVEAYFPSRLPSKALPAYERVSLNDLTVNENGDLVDASGNSWLIGPGGSIIPNTCSAAAGGSDPNSTGRAATNPACPASNSR
jgi:hypothetical protein